MKYPILLSFLLVGAVALSLSACNRNPSDVVANASDSKGKPPTAAVAAAPALSPLPAGGVKAVYLTGWSAGTRKHLDNICALADRTEINAVVLDVKDDGWISYNVDVPQAKEIQQKYGAHKTGKMIADIDAVIAKLKAHKLFVIARIACFRDTPLAETHPKMSVLSADGKPWKDRSRHGWLNPYSVEAQDYNIALGLDAIKHGFQEVQFDYVRFPSEGKLSNLVYPGKPKGGLREDQIAFFLEKAQATFKKQGAWFSADVFGLTSQVKNDEGIGQKFEKVIAHLDYLCPMVYPSHYAKGTYGLPNPNSEPYKLIKGTLTDAKRRIAVAPQCKLRPWLQAFSLGVKYGPAQLAAQIKACRELGINEYLLWNAACSYRLFEPALGKKKA